MGNDQSKSGEGFTMKEKAEGGRADAVDFATFIFSLATGAFIQMGEIPDPATGKKEKNLALAQQNIDILLMMREKTRGNLSSDETQMLESLLTQAQLKFVEVSKK